MLFIEMHVSFKTKISQKYQLFCKNASKFNLLFHAILEKLHKSQHELSKFCLKFPKVSEFCNISQNVIESKWKKSCYLSEDISRLNFFQCKQHFFSITHEFMHAKARINLLVFHIFVKFCRTTLNLELLLVHVSYFFYIHVHRSKILYAMPH